MVATELSTVRETGSAMNELISKIKKACEDCIEDGNKAIEEVTDGSEDIYEGRMEFASTILDLIEEGS